MNSYNVKYSYKKTSSNSSCTLIVGVYGQNEDHARKEANDKAKKAHPGCEIKIMEIKKK